MKRKILFGAIAAALATVGAAQSVKNDGAASPSGTVVPITYVGGNARIGLGLDQDGDLQGEALGILGYDGTRALLLEGWLGHGRSGGIKLAYNWLWGGRTVEDATHASDSVWVAKAFAAIDQNAFDDRKSTLGFGWERRNTAVDVYYSRSLTDERLVFNESSRRIDEITGVDNGRPFRQEITIDTLIQQFEHPYQHGLGLRLGYFIEPALVRMRGGIDLERGTRMLEGRSARQNTVMLGLEKYFSGSGHSLAMTVEHLTKSGPFDRPQHGGRRNDARGSLMWRYDFAAPHRPVHGWREVEISREISEPVAEVGQPRVLRNEIELSGEALFGFDSAVITPEAEMELSGLLDTLRSSRVGEIEIVGHTCDIGNAAYNQRLSERRAGAVRDWLASQGIAVADLRVSGRGELQPRHPNDTEANRRRNRRVDLSFITIEESELPAQQPVTRVITEWSREPEAMPAAWIERALRNPPMHKRQVDTYRIERVSETRTEGPREFINRPPVAIDDTATTTRDTPVSIDVLANDSDPDGDSLSLLSVTDPSHGTISFDVGGIVVYSPAPGFVGSDSFGYTIADPKGLTASARVTVQVEAPANEPPTAQPDSAQTRSGVSVDIDVLANDSDPEDDPLAVVGVGQPGNGTAVIVGAGIVTYTSLPDFVGTDTFTYTIEDGQGNSASALVTILVMPFDRNRPPVAVDDTAFIWKGQTIDIRVLANDYDPDGDPLAITQLFYRSGRANLSLVEGGSVVRYEHIPGYFGDDAFEYEVTDGRGGYDRARVVVTIARPD